MVYDKEKRHQYYLEHKERDKETRKLYRLKNKEKIAASQKIRNDKRKGVPLTEKTKESLREYGKRNRKKNNKYLSNKRKNDPLFRLTWNLRVRVRLAFKNKRYKKTSKTYELLGTTFEKVKQHIEQQFTKGMSWELVGPRIHIDHIMPLASATNKEELIKLCHYTNLQPL